MRDQRPELLRDVRAVVDEYRGRCLWFLAGDYYPETDEQIRRTLDWIERHGDRTAFQKSARLKRWLSQISSATSAA